MYLQLQACCLDRYITAILSVVYIYLVACSNSITIVSREIPTEKDFHESCKAGNTPHFYFQWSFSHFFHDRWLIIEKIMSLYISFFNWSVMSCEVHTPSFESQRHPCASIRVYKKNTFLRFSALFFILCRNILKHFRPVGGDLIPHRTPLKSTTLLKSKKLCLSKCIIWYTIGREIWCWLLIDAKMHNFIPIFWVVLKLIARNARFFAFQTRAWKTGVFCLFFFAYFLLVFFWYTLI